MKLLIVLFCVALLLNGVIYYLKHKAKHESPTYYERPAYFKKLDSLHEEINRWLDTVHVDTATTYVFEGKLNPDTPRVPHTIPIAYKFSNKPIRHNERKDNIGDNEQYYGTFSLSVDSLGNIIDTIPQGGKMPEGFGYLFFDAEKAYKELRKELDSLKLEIQKLKK